MKITRIMKGKRLLPLVALAAMSLVACGGGNKKSDSASQPDSIVSASESKSSAASSSKSSSSRSSSEAPHVHNFQEVAAENGDDYKVMKCTADDAKYLMKAVSAVDAGTTQIAENEKFGKGQSLKYTFTLKKNYKVNFQIGLKISSSSHTDRKFQTYAEGASTDDPFESNSANDGTQRYWLLVNGTRVEVTNTKSYGDNGMNTDEFTEVTLVDEFDLTAGVNTIELCSHASTGYRLFVGNEVRLGVISESEPTPVEKSLDFKKIELKEADGKAIISFEHEFAGYTEAELKALTPYFDAQENPKAVTGGWDGAWRRYTNVTDDSGLRKPNQTYVADLVPLDIVVDGNKVAFNFDVTNFDNYGYTLHFDALNSTLDVINTDNYADFKKGEDIELYEIIVGEKKYGLQCVSNDQDGDFFWGCFGLWVADKPADPIPSDHTHSMVDINHAKLDDEIVEEIKKCSEDTYYEISWNAQADGKTSNGFDGNGKLSGNGTGYVEYKVFAPVAMNARLYSGMTYNTSNLWTRETASDQSIWYNYKSSEAGWKYKLELNGNEIDQSKEKFTLGEEEYTVDQLTFADFGGGSSGAKIEAPWAELQLNKGLNTIRITRLTGYAVNFQNFIIKGLERQLPKVLTYVANSAKVIDVEGKATLSLDFDIGGYTAEEIAALSPQLDFQEVGGAWNKLVQEVKLELDGDIAKLTVDLDHLAFNTYLTHCDLTGTAASIPDFKLPESFEEVYKIGGKKVTLRSVQGSTAQAGYWGCLGFILEDASAKVFHYLDAEARLVDGKACLVIKGDYENYTQAEMNELAATFDIEVNPNHSKHNPENTQTGRTVIDGAQVVAKDDGTFEMIVDITAINWGTYWTHTGIGGAAGDVKLAKAVDSSVKVGNKTYQVYCNPQGQTNETFWGNVALIIEQEAIALSKPIGTFNGVASVSGADTPVIIAIADDMINVKINGVEIAGASFTSFNPATGEFAIALDATYGNLTGTYDSENNSLKNCSIDGPAAAAVGNNGSIVLNGAKLFYDMEGTTEELQAIFQRRDRTSGNWVNDDKVAAEATNVAAGEGALKRDAAENNAVAIALKSDLAQAQNLKYIGLWVYNPSETDITLRTWVYKATGFNSNAEIGTMVAKAGQWTYVSMGFSAANIYNFQISVWNDSPNSLASLGVELVCDNIALF